MSLSLRCLIALVIFVPARALQAGEIIPPGPTIPVHTLMATLEGDYAGLANQEDPRFGFSVALHGDTLAIGAPGVWASAGVSHLPNRGAVFIYRRNPENDHWQFDQRMVFPSLNAGQCGYSVALSEFSLLVGCPFQGLGGRAWLLSRPNSDEPFALDGETFDDDSEQPGAQCGISVALIDGAPGTDSPFSMAAVGCPNRRDFPAMNVGLVGGVDIYVNALSAWGLAASLNGPATTSTDFGRSLSLNRSGPSPGMTLLLAVGIPGTGSSDGSVRIYAADNDSVADWTQEHMLTGPTSGSRFGHSVHMRAGRLAIGAPARSIPNPATNPQFQLTRTGSLSITTRSCNFQGTCTWSQDGDEFIAPLVPIPQTTPQNRMGQSVHVLTPDRVLAGAPLFAFGSFIGQGRHYVILEGEWTLHEDEPFYPAGPALATSEFGAATAGDDTWLAVGAPGYPSALGQDGRVFVYGYDYDDTIFEHDFECPGHPSCL